MARNRGILQEVHRHKASDAKQFPFMPYDSDVTSINEGVGYSRLPGTSATSSEIKTLGRPDRNDQRREQSQDPT